MKDLVIITLLIIIAFGIVNVNTNINKILNVLENDIYKEIEYE